MLGTSLGLERRWAVLSGLWLTWSFVFTGHYQAWLAMPLVLRFLGWPSFGGLIHTALAVMLGVAVGLSTNIIITIPFALVFVVVWAAVVESDWSRRKVVGYLVFLISVVGINLPVLAATVIVARQSHKANVVLARDSLGEFLQNIFLTWNSLCLVIVLILAFILGWPLLRPVRRMIWAFAILAGFAALGNSIIAEFSGEMGIFRALKLSRFDGGFQLLAIFGTCGIIATKPWAAAAKSPVPRQRPWRRLWPPSENLVIGLVLGALLVGAVEVKFDRVQNWVVKGSYRAIYEFPFAEMLRQRIARTGPARLVSIWTESSFANAQGFEAADGYGNLVPSRYLELWFRVTVGAAVSKEMTKMIEADRAWGNRLTLKLDTRSEKSAGVEFARLFDLDILSLLNVGYIISRKQLNHPDLVPIWKAEYDWFGLPWRKKLSANLRESLFGLESFSVYENRRVFPRFRLTCAARIFDTDQELLDALSAADHADLRTTAFLSREEFSLPAMHLGQSAAEISLDCSGSANILSQHPDRQVVRTAARVPTVLIWSSSYNSWWRAKVDGEDCDIFPVNHALTGIFLPPGSHQVELSYVPPFSWLGLRELLPGTN